ncbi:HINT domain-containing protein [Clostridium weizhouense]|uniref:HINT domain-containing protein n=1 Tax=Clostridium weizhouense TaxID=2859781 RepID=UPI0021561BEE|nr:HINT domain-containing protein [Clostridium weizhouense]
MDFNIGNLVIGAVGGMAKIGSAVGNALSPVAKCGGLPGSFAGVIAGVAAVLANVCEDGEIDEEEEELLEEVFKLLVGALIARFGSGRSENDNSKDSNVNPFVKSWNSIKEIGCDFWNGLDDRRQRALDSPYDFVNWLTLGIPDGVKASLQENAKRSEKAFNSGYDFTNWITLGNVDMVNETFNPKDPLSKEHWLNSFGTVSTLFGIKQTKGTTIPEKDVLAVPQKGEVVNKWGSEAGGLCFTEETLVLIKDGHKHIKDIKIGDEVYSQNQYTGEKGLKKVTDLFVNETDRLVHISIKETEIKATPTHPFWVVDKGWIVAEELEVGDNVQLYSGQVIEVTSLKFELIEEHVKVYNFEVEEWHTYYVSNRGVLVHNTCSEYVPNNPKWAGAGTDMWTWAEENNYKLSFGGGTDIGKMFVSNSEGEVIGEIHSGQLVNRGVNAGKEFQIHFEYYYEGTTKTDDSLHLYFED